MFFRAAGWVAILAAGAMAQESAPPGFLHGGFLAWTGTARSGEFTFQAAQDRVYFCSYDEKTYIERDNRRSTLADAERGDRLEIVSDEKAGSNVCYARTVHILTVPARYTAPGVRPRVRPAASVPLFQPHANLSFSGAVFRITPEFLTLRSRTGEHRILRLRADTHYYSDGQSADLRSLQVNTVVYVRGARDLYGQLEAYQVIWGDILQPGR